MRVFPALRSEALVGAVQYYDAQVDDARHTVAVGRTAAAPAPGWRPAPRSPTCSGTGERSSGSRSVTSRAGKDLEVRARRVINATGVWTDGTQALAGGGASIHVRASKGVHLVLPRDRIDSARPA